MRWLRYLRCLIRGYHMGTGVTDEGTLIRRCSECREPMGAERSAGSGETT